MALSDLDTMLTFIKGELTKTLRNAFAKVNFSWLFTFCFWLFFVCDEVSFQPTRVSIPKNQFYFPFPKLFFFVQLKRNEELVPAGFRSFWLYKRIINFLCMPSFSQNLRKRKRKILISWRRAIPRPIPTQPSLSFQIEPLSKEVSNSRQI